MEEYLNFISKVPEIDSPEVLGLHPNADLTFRFKEVITHSLTYSLTHSLTHSLTQGNAAA